MNRLRLPIRWSLLGVLLCCCASGCVQRRLTIRSNPPGAMVLVDNQQIGNTPISTPFTYYGTRQIKLIKDGFETLEVQQKFRAPWYQVPPLDLVSETLVPWEQRDERVLDFQLVPQQVVPTQAILGRAESLRQGAQQGYVAPLPQRPPGAIGALPVPGMPQTIPPQSALP